MVDFATFIFNNLSKVILDLNFKLTKSGGHSNDVNLDIGRDSGKIDFTLFIDDTSIQVKKISFELETELEKEYSIGTTFQSQVELLDLLYIIFSLYKEGLDKFEFLTLALDTSISNSLDFFQYVLSQSQISYSIIDDKNMYLYEVGLIYVENKNLLVFQGLKGLSYHYQIDEVEDFGLILDKLLLDIDIYLEGQLTLLQVDANAEFGEIGTSGSGDTNFGEDFDNSESDLDFSAISTDTLSDDIEIEEV